jgi:8-oxo-dGTP pyrophosphatase MutT (NUDIX family)
LIGQGCHFGLYHLQTKVGGAREMLCRNSFRTVACKALPLLVDEATADKVTLRGRCRIADFASAIVSHNLFAKATVPLLACDRPVTYFPGRKKLKKNWLFELPGGVVEDSERFSLAGLREMLEELGISRKQILCFCCLAKPRPFDSGSHAEWTGMVAAICSGEVRPPRKEGIIPAKCENVPFGEISRFIAQADKNGIGVEGYIEAAQTRLLAEMYKAKSQMTQ